MIKKIQQYLLLHYPLIWNIRLVPMLLILIAIHLLIFGISFLSSEIVFKDYYYYYSMINSNGTMYTASIFVGILILIGWLIFYMRNNAVKVFYPRKTINIFTEWGLTFIICLMITSLPISLSTGTISRWRMIASEKQTNKTLDMLQKAQVLIPEDMNEYTFNKELDKPLPIVDSIKVDPHKVDLDLYAFDYTLQGNIAIRGYKGPSLLFYSDYEYNSFYESKNRGGYFYDNDNEIRRKVNNINTVKQWLRTGQQDSIYALMNEFCELAKKHDLPIKISPELWMKRVYNPPYFEVNKAMLIGSRVDEEDPYYEYSNSPNYYKGYDPDRELYYVNNYYSDTLMVGTEAEADFFYKSTIAYSLPLRQLQSGYNQVRESYASNEELRNIALVCICAALILSVFIFSCRMTSGRSWLIGFVLSGVLLFAVILMMIIMSELGGMHDKVWVMLFTLFWIVLFLAIIVYLTGKIMNKKNKGRSRPLVNIMLWLLPCIIPLSYAFCIAFYENISGNYYSPTNDAVSIMFWINIPVVAITMYFIALLLRKWKSLPEE